jgi:hypothetical protein
MAGGSHHQICRHTKRAIGITDSPILRSEVRGRDSLARCSGSGVLTATTRGARLLKESQGAVAPGRVVASERCAAVSPCPGAKRGRALISTADVGGLNSANSGKGGAGHGGSSERRPGSGSGGSWKQTSLVPFSGSRRLDVVDLVALDIRRRPGPLHCRSECIPFIRGMEWSAGRPIQPRRDFPRSRDLAGSSDS